MKFFTWNCSGKLLYWDKPIVMGILNATPDSFYSNSRIQNEKELLAHAEKMLHDGAAILDIGGLSTRPNAPLISESEEIDRIKNSIKVLHQHFPDALISIDTYHSSVANVALDNGASIINDISGGMEDSAMFETAASNKAPLILMHRKGNALTMQQQTHYDNILTEMYAYFLAQINKAREAGVTDLAIDLGYGFSKTLEQNYFLLKNQAYFSSLDLPILTGISRKSMLYKLFDTQPERALNATSAANILALVNGASILRVHDVKEAVECVAIFHKTFSSTNP